MNAPATMDSPQPIKLTVSDYELLDRSGALDRYGKVELIEGVIVAVSAQMRRHMYAKSELAWRLREALQRYSSAWFVGVEATVELSPHDMPDPDIIITDAPVGDGYIPARSVQMVVEVADTSLAFDVGKKAVLYATYIVPEYWVIDLKNDLVRQFWQAEHQSYAQVRETPIGERVTSAVHPWLAVETRDLV